MADNWSETERQTNRLVRSVAAWLFAQKTITPNQLSGMVRLTWITAGRVNPNSYIRSVKIPALGMIFKADYSNKPLTEVAKEISRRTGNPKLGGEILKKTGFTNTYNAYRNSSTDRMRRHYKVVLPLMRAAYALRTDTEGHSLAERIDALPRIRRPDKSNPLHPANFLTPVMFALDKRIRFPILNVTGLLLPFATGYRLMTVALSGWEGLPRVEWILLGELSRLAGSLCNGGSTS